MWKGNKNVAVLNKLMESQTLPLFANKSPNKQHLQLLSQGSFAKT